MKIKSSDGYNQVTRNVPHLRDRIVVDARPQSLRAISVAEKFELRCCSMLKYRTACFALVDL